MSSAPDVVISGVGAVTPVGLSAPATASALRAGIARLAEIEGWSVDGKWIPAKGVIGGRVPLEWLHGGPSEGHWPGHERFDVEPPIDEHLRVASGSGRLVEMALQAAAEATLAARLPERPPRKLELHLGLAEDEPEKPICAELRVALSLDEERVHAHRAGRAAALVALHEAFARLADGKTDCAIVGGVDSWIRHEIVEKLDGAERLKKSRDSHGLLPGEAAAFVVIEREADARARGATAFARLRSTGIAEEPTAGKDEPNQAVGLTRALRRAQADAGGLDGPLLVVCDLNGERYRSLEWGLANVRLAYNRGGFDDVWHPADCLGDSGAASGALGLVWSAIALTRGYAGQRNVLLWGASDSKARAAAVVSKLAS